jgi:transcriptional antiterminator NusG
MRKSEVNRMLGRMDELSEFATMLKFLIVGENVKVIDGPFNGFNGTVEKFLKIKRKLKFLFLFSVEKLQWNLAICR